MFNVLFSGRLTKQPERDRDGNWLTSMVGDDGRAARLYLASRQQLERIRGLRKGARVSGTGNLKVIPTLNRNGEARAFIHIHVEDLITLETTND